MEYNSIYDVLRKESFGNHPIFSTFVYSAMRFKGTLENVFEDLNQLCSEKNHSELDLYQLIFQPTRILKTLMDSKEYLTNNLDVRKYSILMKESLSLVSDIYDYNNYEEKSLEDKLIYLKKLLEEIKDNPIIQKADCVTWNASNPEFSQESANLLYQSINNSPTLFIPLAHGGTSAGIDVFLRFKSLSQSENSIIYPIRYSRYKLNDINPKISDFEKGYFRELAKTHQVVLFDEDCEDGGTINTAKQYFLEHLEIPTYVIINDPSPELSNYRFIDKHKLQ